MGAASIIFLSGQPSANVMGATASILLEIDEAQDFKEDKFLREFLPMVAATNATIALFGTAWTSDSYLEHTRLENRRLEAVDGHRRNFAYPWSVVAQYVPSYRTHVLRVSAHMGASHPIIRSQYGLECLDSLGHLLSETQIAQIQLSPSQPPMPLRQDELSPRDPLSHPVVEEARELPTERRQPTAAHTSSPSPSGAAHTSSPSPSGRGQGEGGAFSSSANELYVAGIDLSGEDEEAEDAVLRAREPRRDSTAITIARVVWHNEAGLEEPHLQVVHFYWWTGRKHRELVPQLIDLLKNVWRCQCVVVDATGVGAGISSLLFGALGGDVVHPFSFSAVSKSDLGYALLSAVNGGRLKVPTDPHDLQPPPGLTHLPPSYVPRPSHQGVRGAMPPDSFERLGEGTPGLTLSPLAPGGSGGSGPLTQSEVLAEGASFRPEGEAPLAEFWRQARLARPSLHANQRLSFYVDPREGHDDLLISVALAVEAAQHSRPRVATGRVSRR